MEDQKRLLDACRRLVLLNEDPQPGLMTWNGMCCNAVEEIRAALGNERDQLASMLKRAKIALISFPTDLGGTTVACNRDDIDINFNFDHRGALVAVSAHEV